MLFDPCTWLIVSLLLVCFVWVEPGDKFANEEPVEFAFKDPVNSDNCAGKMTVTLDVTTIIAMLVASFYHFVVLPIICSSSLPIAMSASNLFTLPSKPLLGYVTALLSLSYSVVSCR